MAEKSSFCVSPFKQKYLWIIATLCCLIGISSAQLSPNFYGGKCSQALRTIRNMVEDAVSKESRMGASLLRLHFHDCFVQGCDASVLLEDTATFTGERNSFPNAKSLRGFEVIDAIKSKLEEMCPGTISCADILAVAARDAVFALGGPRWEVRLGRRDSTTASLDKSNSELPSPFLDFSGLVTAFANKNFTVQEMVTLSGAHTVGQVRCNLFRKRIYNESNIEEDFKQEMQAECPFDNGDTNMSNLDSTTPTSFDNAYFKNLVQFKGLLHSDQQLFVRDENGNNGPTNFQVLKYSKSFGSFKHDFANAMAKLSMLSPLTGTDGEIRNNCNFVNSSPSPSPSPSPLS